MASVYALSTPVDLTQIISATKPTARSDASALVVGDRWVNTTDFVNCFWNGTFWLGTAIISSSNTASATSPTPAFAAIAASVGSQIFLDFAFFTYINNSGSPTINYYQLGLCTRQTWNSGAVSRAAINANSATAFGNGIVAINTALTSGTNTGQVSEFCFSYTAVGTPASTSQFVVGVQYRRIY